MGGLFGKDRGYAVAGFAKLLSKCEGAAHAAKRRLVFGLEGFLEFLIMNC